LSIIKEGDTVTVHYTVTLTSGEVFDSSKDREPLSFTLGKGQLIAGFEKAVIGLSVILGCLSTYSQKSTLSQYSTLLGVYSSARVHQACDLPSVGDVDCNENKNGSIGVVAMPMT